jgi:hypothetical protein
MGHVDRNWVQDELGLLDRLGPRLTGSAAHDELISHVAQQLADLGLDVQEDRYSFTRWEHPVAERLRLSVAGQPVPVCAAFPYSGNTGPGGVQGDLRLLKGPLPRWSAARGGVAVIEVRNRALPLGALIPVWDGGAPLDWQRNPLGPATIAGLGLPRARRAGVQAVVFAWRDISPVNAQGQYLSFIAPYLDIPAVFVAGDASDQVIAAAREKQTAALVLDAALVPDSPTRTIWAVAPGTSRPHETVLVVSHSDGTNAVEENGHIALVSLARDVAASPPERTTVFVLTTGHLRIPAFTDHGQATSRWLTDHPEQWAGGPNESQAVAALVIEHLGAREYQDNPVTNEYGPTGRPEPEVIYASTRQVKDLVDAEWRSAATPPRVSKPGAFVQFGEGEPLYQRKIPAISLITMPQYLLSLEPGDYVDVDLLTRQVDSFHRLRRRLDTLPQGAFGTVTPPKLSTKAKTLAQIASGLINGRAR